MHDRQRASTPLGTGGRHRTRDRRRGEARKAGALTRVALLCFIVVAVVEKTTTTEVLRHPVTRPLKHRRDVARREVQKGAERELVAVLFRVPIDAVEEHGVDMRVQLQIRRGPLHRNHRAALSAPADDAALAVEVEDGLDEEARQRREQRSIVAEALAPRERHREHPLAKRDGERQDVLDEMRRGRRHLPTKARWTEAATLAAERHQPRLLAAVAPKAREAAAEKAAVEVALELLPHELGQRDRDRAVVHSAVERGEVVLHHLVERRLLWSSTLVDDRGRRHVAPTASAGPKARRCNLATLRSASPVADTFRLSPGHLLSGAPRARRPSEPVNESETPRLMTMKCELRKLRVLGCEATAKSVTLHLRDDTPLDPKKILELVKSPRSPYKLTPDRLTRRFENGVDGLANGETMLVELSRCWRD